MAASALPWEALPALAATPVRVHFSLAKRVHLSSSGGVSRSVDANDRRLAQRLRNAAQEPLRRVKAINTVPVVESDPGVDIQGVPSGHEGLQVRKRLVCRPFVVSPPPPPVAVHDELARSHLVDTDLGLDRKVVTVTVSLVPRQETTVEGHSKGTVGIPLSSDPEFDLVGALDLLPEDQVAFLRINALRLVPRFEPCPGHGVVRGVVRPPSGISGSLRR